MEASLQKNRKKSVKVPAKKSLNLYQPDLKNNPKTIIAIGIVVIVLLTAFLSKTFIFDGLKEIQNMKDEISSLEFELSKMNKSVENYAELKETYYRYSESYSKDEAQLVDRISIMRILEEVTDQYGRVTSVSISGNSVSIRVITSSLDELSKLKYVLENNDKVVDVVVYSAQRSTGDVVSVVAFSCIL